MLRNLGITLKKILLLRRAVGGETRAVQGQAKEGSRRKAHLRGRGRRRQALSARKRPRPAGRKGRRLQARERCGGAAQRRILRAHVLPATDQLRLVRGVVRGEPASSAPPRRELRDNPGQRELPPQGGLAKARAGQGSDIVPDAVFTGLQPDREIAGEHEALAARRRP